MNEGVKILIERMKTNPEEFIAEAQYGVSKWGNVIGNYKTYLTEEDTKALDDAWKETINIVMQERFTQAVMKELLAPEEEDDLGKWFTKQAGGTQSAGQTPLRSSVALNNTNLVYNGGTSSWQAQAQAQQASGTIAQAYQMEQLKAHLDAHRHALKEEEAQQLKQHQTLFGKLKNYLHTD